MNNRLLLLAATASAVAVFCARAAAADGAAGASAGAPVPLTFDNGRGTFEIIERLRFEDRSDNFDFDSAAKSPTDDSWFVQRLRLGATWKPDSATTFQLQLQDAREWGSERPKVPFIFGAEGNDALDVRLASVTFGDPKKSPAVVTLGRQILALGEERLVGPGEWNNFARSFDAAKIVWKPAPDATTIATAFISSVVHVEGTTSGDGWEFDRSSRDDVFAGVNLALKLDKTRTLEGYFLWREKQDHSPLYTAPNAAIPVPARTAAAYDIGQRVGTLGLRYIMPPAPAKDGGFDGEVEAAWQFGGVDRQTTTAAGPYGGSKAQLDHNAWALHTLVGYTPPASAWRWRFDIECNLASGDTNRTDGKNGSFMTLFPSGHKFCGFMDLIAWKNLREYVGTIRFAPAPKTSVRVDYHRFGLYTTQDAWYRKNGVATVRPLNAAAQTAASSRPGDELDVTVAWTAQPWMTIDVGWSRFFAGAYLRATGASSDADFFYVQPTVKF